MLLDCPGEPLAKLREFRDHSPEPLKIFLARKVLGGLNFPSLCIVQGDLHVLLGPQMVRLKTLVLLWVKGESLNLPAYVMPSDVRHLEVQEAEVADDRRESEKVRLSEHTKVTRGSVHREDLRVETPICFDNPMAL